jgi:hypothetical protein
MSKRQMHVSGDGVLSGECVVIILYPFSEAPEEWQSICSQGGDEDYIALVIGDYSEYDLPSMVCGREEFHLDTRKGKFAGITLIVGYHS